ncbi:hypothetical protein PVK64_02090 [Aliivibrio sp. S4TY2]|uniref:hypothetical protein n=1 Tax=unclassified Aliivibrio TaxID=2645654 RepID=UPI0023785ADC|nr:MULTISPECIES: hypothetical protein [unclassified Aliivibrio]MDD9154983.1 hypothetical protein [Aliivibrio sp. S4TY2]MDD9158654.1 hypothetical protein [Aliivibrio sp. S4TY1]
MLRATSLILILAICLIGYFLLDRLPNRRHILRDGSGYHTFFSSAAAGLVLMVPALLLYVLADCIFTSLSWYFSLGEIILNYVLKSESTESTVILFDMMAFAFILSFVIPYIATRGDNEYFFESFADYGDSPEFTDLLLRSTRKGLPILFTMSDRKVYIGYAREIHAQHFTDINIIPVFAGYRDKNTLKLVLTTPYRNVIEQLKTTDKDTPGLFTITLPVKEITHAHMHSFEHYKNFQEAEGHVEEYLKSI